jgi:hypothetical protein
MTEITIKITETQVKILVQLLNMVQVRISEAPELIDLKARIEAAQEG